MMHDLTFPLEVFLKIKFMLHDHAAYTSVFSLRVQQFSLETIWSLINLLPLYNRLYHVYDENDDFFLGNVIAAYACNYVGQ